MNNTLVKMPAPDPRYYFYTRLNSVSDMVVVREIWSENVYELYDGDLSDTGIVVDIGANIGAFTLFAAKMGAKRVIAVEPEPHNIELLKKNIEENQKHSDCKIVVDTHGIGDGKFSKAYIEDNHGDSVVSFGDTQPASAQQISIISLERLFEIYSLEYIDVLKIDVEGMEGNILLNTPKSVMNLCRYITLEYDQHANDLGAIVEKLVETHQIKAVGAHGGMIFAKRY